MCLHSQRAGRVKSVPAQDTSTRGDNQPTAGLVGEERVVTNKSGLMSPCHTVDGAIHLRGSCGGVHILRLRLIPSCSAPQRPVKTLVPPFLPLWNLPLTSLPSSSSSRLVFSPFRLFISSYSFPISRVHWPREYACLSPFAPSNFDVIIPSCLLCSYLIWRSWLPISFLLSALFFCLLFFFAFFFCLLLSLSVAIPAFPHLRHKLPLTSCDAILLSPFTTLTWQSLSLLYLPL